MASRDDVLEILLQDRAVHPYGLTDVAQLWDRSSWHRRRSAVVGTVDVPGSELPIVYAIAAGPTQSTLDLLSDLSPRLPPRFILHAAIGAADRLDDSGLRVLWRSTYTKMYLADPDGLPPADHRVEQLERSDLSRLHALYATDERAGDFFHAGLLDTGPYVGLTVNGRLVSAAGVHVFCPTHGVAAIGNLTTHPGHRRRGAARAVLATLCHRLLQNVDVIGLNVRQDNQASLLYRQVGFQPQIPYEEAELVAQQDHR